MTIARSSLASVCVYILRKNLQLLLQLDNKLKIPQMPWYTLHSTENGIGITALQGTSPYP